jgi:hypothetical protein
MFFLFFIFFEPLLLSNLTTFLFTLNDLNCYKSSTWSFTNHFETLIITKQHTKNFLSVWEPAFVTFNGLFFFEFLTPLLWEVITFSFLTIFSALDVPKRGVQVLFGHHKQWALPLDPTSLECLNVRSPTDLPYIPKLFSSTNAYYQCMWLWWICSNCTD